MYILGISCFYHDSAVTLLKDGVVVAAAQEERFTRKKHDNSFPGKAIEWCLKDQGINIKDIAYIGFYEKPFLKFERLLHQYIETFPKSYRNFLASMPSWFNEKLRVVKVIRKKLKYKKDIFFIEHHMAHAASSFLPSPFENAAILTVDGAGEWTTTAYGTGKKSEIYLSKEIKFPSSIGLLYSTLTAYLGFSVNNSEYKVMGLSAYGDMNKKTNPYYDKLKSVLDIKKDGSYRLDMSYFDYHFSRNKMPSKKLCNLLGGKIRNPEGELTQRHKDIAAGLQIVTEEILTDILRHIKKETNMKNLVISGGVALNSVYNGKLLKNTGFKKIWIQPDPGDGGTSMGAALYVYNVILNKKRVYKLEDVYLGPSFTDKEIKEFLTNNKIKYKEYKNEKDITRDVAGLIYKNNVVGWFQKGMEWGPRALGARSILSNSTNPKMQEILNLKVKHREKFRPFAPVICKEDIGKYFECGNLFSEPSDFMLMVYPIKKKWHKKIPSVTHVDGTGRLQTIKKEQNHLYYDLINEFGKLSGIPILINTSFNIRGEPIVCSPYDAYRCMMGTEIDYLLIGKFLINRKENLQDIWNGEKYAKD